jgi:endonuclease/exonuclease/phosphatase family metal-dependent hydrolase
MPLKRIRRALTRTPQLPAPTPHRPEGTLRAATFNIAHGRARWISQVVVSRRRLERHLDAIGGLAQRIDADFLALQEADTDAAWTRRIDQPHRVGTTADLFHVYRGHNSEIHRPFPLVYGNATLSRHEAQRSSAQRFGKGRLGGKGFLRTEFVVDGAEVTLLNVHLDPISDRRRRRQLERVARDLHDIDHATIVLGDFNSDLHTGRSLQQFADHAGLRPATPSEGLHHTFEKLGRRSRLDFILGSHHVEFVGAHVVSTRLSDHLPLLADFRLL